MIVRFVDNVRIVDHHYLNVFPP